MTEATEPYRFLRRTFNVDALRQSHAQIRTRYASTRATASAAIFCSPALSQDVDQLLHACEMANIVATPYDASDFKGVGDLISALPNYDMAIVLANAPFVNAPNAMNQIQWAQQYNEKIRFSWVCRDVFEDRHADLAAYASLTMPWPLDHGTWDDVFHFLMLEVLEIRVGRRPRGGPPHRNAAQ